MEQNPKQKDTNAQKDTAKGHPGLLPGWGLGSTGARLARLGLGSIGARARVDWASVHVNWSEGWIGAWLDWGVVGLGAAGLGTIVADGKRRRMKVGWAGTSQVARRCIRVGVWEVHGGCAHKGRVDQHNWRTCVVGLDAERCARALYNQNGKNSDSRQIRTYAMW